MVKIGKNQNNSQKVQLSKFFTGATSASSFCTVARGIPLLDSSTSFVCVSVLFRTADWSEFDPVLMPFAERDLVGSRFVEVRENKIILQIIPSSAKRQRNSSTTYAMFFVSDTVSKMVATLPRMIDTDKSAMNFEILVRKEFVVRNVALVSEVFILCKIQIMRMPIASVVISRYTPAKTITL